MGTVPAKPNVLESPSPTQPRKIVKGKGKGKSTASAKPTLLESPTPTPPRKVVKGKGKGKGKNPFDKKSMFQVTLEGLWKDYSKQEDMVLKRAFLIGHPHARYAIRGQNYECNFNSMKQVNLGTGKVREMRPPMGMRPPQEPLLPSGPVVILTVAPGTSGSTIEISDPQNKGRMVKVNVPQKAKAGQKMAVPMPEKDETVEQVAAKQQTWNAGKELAARAGAVGVVGAAAVGGALLGDHLAGGDMAGDVADAVVDLAGDAGEWVAGAADDVGDWAPGAAEDVGDWVAGAADDLGDWTTGAAEDVADWAPGFTDDVGEWLGDAAEDSGDFIMSLF